MIVTERKMLVDLGDVKHVRITCSHCGTVHAMPVDSEHHLWTRCASCRTEWFSSEGSEPKLLRLLRMLRRVKNEDVELQLELDCVEDC